MFIGKSGIGKKLIAKEFAKSIMCINFQEQIQNGNLNSCDKCKSCLEFNTNNNPDFFLIQKEENENNIKIEKIRDLQKRIQEKPIISSRKIYIIDDANTMTKEAQNCLLKTLEEPPEFAIIILIGTNENSFLSTIKSRCMIIRFGAIKNEELEKYLKETMNFNNLDKDILEISQGSIGKALEIKDDIQTYEEIKNIINQIETKDIIEILKMSEGLYKAKDKINELLDYINVLLINKAKKEYKYTNAIQIVENTKARLKSNSNYDMCIDNMLFNIWEEIN